MESRPPSLSTSDRADALASALTCFPHAMGEDVQAHDLLEWVRLELGHAQALDGLCSRGSIKTVARAPQSILHVVAGNTPNAAIQSVTCGLLLGSRNRVKLPSGAESVATAVAQFVSALPNDLASLVETNQELPEEWLTHSEAVIVYGSDETVSHFRSRVKPWQRFLAHGHKLSFGIVFDVSREGVAAAAARDVSLFDQQGCLSLHGIYVDERRAGEGSARDFAGRLATEMETFNCLQRRAAITPGEAQEIQDLRSSYAFRAANDDRVAVWQSEGSTAWTVIYEDDPQFAVSCLNRLVFVKPLPPLESMPEHLRFVRPHLSTIAMDPLTDAHVAAVLGLGATRICRLGDSQSPTPFWHQDGIATLSSLVDWIDVDLRDDL